MSDRQSMLTQPLHRPSAGRMAAYLGLFMLGLVVGAAGSLVQAAWFPGGLLLALAGAAGWMLAVILLTASRPEGDFLFAAGVGSYAYLLGGMAVAVICATLAPTRQPGGRSVRLGE